MVPSIISDKILLGMSAITSVLRNHETASVRLRFEPSKLEALADIVALRYPRLDDLNIIGFVEGCKVAIKTPSSVVDATATYNGWLHGHFQSNVLAFDAWGPLHYRTWVGLVVVGVAFHFSSKQAAALDEVFWGIRTTFT